MAIRQLRDGYGIKFVLEEGDRTVVIAEVPPVLLTQPQQYRGHLPDAPLYQDQVQVVRQSGLR